MAQDGFDMQVLIPNNAPFYYDVDGAIGASVSRSLNRSIARILRRYPNKFFGIAIATAPLQNIDLAIAETEYAIKELGLHAVIIYQTSTAGILIASFAGRFTNASKDLVFPFWFTV